MKHFTVVIFALFPLLGFTQIGAMKVVHDAQARKEIKGE